MSDWPKWVVPHKSHIKVRAARQGEGIQNHENALLVAGESIPDQIIVMDFEHFHVRRDGVVTVIVATAEQEARALAAYRD